jgi:2-methylisocitrate lyase-like PEP mutase family enzyme
LYNLKALVAGRELIVAPVALNPIMARLAEEAGFKAVYLAGVALGWLKCISEANLTLPEMVDIAIDIRVACKLPIVLDAGSGFGDPVHLHRTIALTEAAGCAAIEIEDRPLPRRVSHHVGAGDWLLPIEAMVAKIEEAVAARNDPNLVIIARTNAVALEGIDAALRRGEALHKAGADMLLVSTRSPNDLRTIGECLPPPLGLFIPPGGLAALELSPRELAALGFRLALDPGAAFAAMFKALRQSYAHLAGDTAEPYLTADEVEAETRAAMRVSGLDLLLAIERRTLGDA